MVGGTLESEFLDPVAERVGMQAENFCSATRAFNDSSGLIEHRGDVSALQLFKRKRCGGRCNWQLNRF